MIISSQALNLLKVSFGSIERAFFTDNANDLQLSPSSASGPFDPLENTTFLIGGLLEPDRIRSHNMSVDQISDIVENKMVVGDVIVQILKMIRCSDTIYLVDPIHSQSFQGRFFPPHRKQPSNITKILLPYNQDQHSSLFEVDLKHDPYTWRHYDSWSSN